jgi:K+-sensing histidine kinase KdpD
MTIGEKFKGFSNDLQVGAKNASHSMLHSAVRLISGFFIGLVLSLIIQELTQSGNLILVFLTVVLTTAIYKALGRMALMQILIFDLICVLIGTVLRMYIMIAP